MNYLIFKILLIAKGSLNNIFQDSFNKILSQQLTHDRSYIYVMRKHTNIYNISLFVFKEIQGLIDML